MRNFIASCIRAVFGFIPTPALKVIARLHPSIYYLFPKNREYACVHLGKYKMQVSTLYPIEGAILAGTYEPEIMDIVRQYVRDGMTAIDVGANVGAITFALADRVGPAGKVFAFEPGPTTFSRLSRNIALNPAISGTIHPNNLGVGETPGELVYHELAHCRGNAILGDLDPQYQAHESHRVPVTTIDDYVTSERIGKVDFMKIDVEGMEYEVLLGAQKTLLRDHPVIIFETLRDVKEKSGSHNFTRIETFMLSIGYDLFVADGTQKGLRATPENFTMNTLAVRSGA